jgi:hypothetical protein
MLKTVSSITNAIGALNFKGTWDANANSPALASSVGTKGDYYVVGTAGSTNLNGISNWGVGDLATFNGSVWQRVEGGADLNGVNLSVSGTSTLSNLTASTALALNASKEIVSVTNTGTGDNVLATAPTLVGDVTLSTGNLVVSDGKGIDFSATPSTGTSELFADYEEGDWTPTYTGNTTDPTVTYSVQVGRYTKVGRTVTASFRINLSAATGGSGDLRVSGLPFATLNATNVIHTTAYAYKTNWTTLGPEAAYITPNTTNMFLFAGSATGLTSITTANLSNNCQLIFSVTYQAN